MQEPVRIAFRGMDTPIGAEEDIRRRVADLEHFYPRLTACRVVVEAGHHHQRKGRLYRVRIDMVTPEREIVVDRDPPEHHAHEDVPVAIHDAFDAARRRLQDHARAQRGEVKAHAAPAIGRIARLVPEQDHGFLLTEDGQEVYLHRNAVLGGGFDALKVGDRVRYVVDEGQGERGPHASTVVPI